MLNRDEADALEQTIENLLDLPVSKKYRERMRHAIRELDRLLKAAQVRGRVKP